MRKFLNKIPVRSFSSSVGFIGLGEMGGNMVNNLVSKGVKVYGFDSTPEKTKSLKSSNFTPVEKLSDYSNYAADIKTYITMVPNEKIVKEILCENLFKIAKKGSFFVDSSTISPNGVRDIHRNAEKNSQLFYDAPVSGGITGAKNGTLAFMLGSGEDGKQKLEEILLKMGAKVIPCGGIGNGQVAKMCNNLALAIQMGSVCEATVLAEKNGMDPKILYEIMRISTSKCWSVDTYNPIPGVLENVPASRNYDGGFVCELMLKDLKIAEESSKSSNTELFLAKEATKIYENAVKNGFGRKDFGVFYKILKDLNKV